MENYEMQTEKQGNYKITWNEEIIQIKDPAGQGGSFQKHSYTFYASSPDGKGMNGYVFRAGDKYTTLKDWNYFIDTLKIVNNVVLTEKHLPQWLM
jgi:catechol-2,3-dioxygenase